MSLELHYGSFQRECCKRSLTANRWQYSPPKMDGCETTASHMTAQPTCWKRIKRNWQVTITAVWMSFVMADSFVSLTDALVRKTLKYWWWILWWIWMADDLDGGCCCQARVTVTPDSDQKENRKSDKADVSFGIPESTVVKKTLTDAISVKWLRIFTPTSYERFCKWTHTQEFGRLQPTLLFLPQLGGEGHHTCLFIVSSGFYISKCHAFSTARYM